MFEFLKLEIRILFKICNLIFEIMNKTWKLKPKIPDELINQYQDYDPLLAQLLYNRRLIQKHQIDEFLFPEYERLHSPFLFKDMEKAVDRIWQAISQNQKICIYGDYDADAVTANAVLRQVFNFLNYQQVESYIPDRFAEGYGVNLDALTRIKDGGSKLIITVDCGTNSSEAVEFCVNNGIDFIITDHHEIIGALPKAFALINPKNAADDYPDQNVTGVGVAFKLAAAVLKNPRTKIQVPNYVDGYEKWLLDLVAIGTVADCHELLGENRILVKYGLKVLEKTKWLGLWALAFSAGLDFKQKPPDTYVLGFIIAPRLNAAGRLEHANMALQLLLETGKATAQQQAKALEDLNHRRQDTTARILSEVREQALLLKDRKVLVMMNHAWHKGVVGLVAGKIAEEFYKPTIVLQMERADEAIGSARSVGEFDIIAALKHSQSQLLSYGGHQAAAGLALHPDNFETFYQKILEFADLNLSVTDISPVLAIEAELDENQLFLSTVERLAQLEPFGAGNP